MYSIHLSTIIRASPQKCFDLARNVEAHLQSAAASGERVIGGPTSGLLQLGDEITFQGRHFGFRLRLTSRMTIVNPYTHFQDRMMRGPFRFFEHDHYFEALSDGSTRMIDDLKFAAPFGPLGWIAERVLVGPHLRKFLVHRAAELKQMVEGD